jgi:hypothetical protein
MIFNVEGGFVEMLNNEVSLLVSGVKEDWYFLDVENIEAPPPQVLRRWRLCFYCSKSMLHDQLPCHI